MRWRGFAAALAVAGACGWLGSRAFTDEGAAPAPGEPAAEKPAEKPDAGQPAAGQPPAMTSEQMEKMFQEWATPGPMHAWLAKTNGTWHTDGKFWEPDGKMTQSGGTATFRMALGGRFQEQTVESSMKAQPFTGYGLTGYDNAKKQFVAFWIDSMGTGFTTALGTLSDDKRVLTLTGEMEMGPMKVPFREVITWGDADHFTFQMFGSMGGKEMQWVEMAYSRSAAPSSGSQACCRRTTCCTPCWWPCWSWCCCR